MRAAVLLSSLNEVLDDERARNSRDQRVLLHVHGISLDGRQAVVVCELILGVHDDGLHGATVQCALAHRLHILATLAQVERDGNDLAAGHLSEVRNGDRGIQATGVREHNACSHGFYLLARLWK